VNRTAQSKAALAVTLVLLCSAVTTFLPTSSVSSSGPSSLTGVAGLESYFTNLWNPSVGLISVGTQTNCHGACGGVQFYFMNDTGAPIFPTAYRFLPNENWADAEAFIGLGFRPDISSAILNTLQSLESSVGWRPAENRETQWGFIVSYDKTNQNIVFLTPQQKNLVVPGTNTQFQLDSAARWNFNTQSWVPFNPNVKAALGCGQPPDETLFQALNLYLRGDYSDAMANLQCVANTLSMNPDGSVLIGPAPARGMYLGSFLEAAEVIGTPNMPNGITLNDVANTIWGLQQSDGGIARQYSDFTTNVLGSDDETTNAALLAFSPGVISNIQSIAASGEYNLSSVPNVTPQLGGGGTTTTTTSTSSTSSTTSSTSSTSTTRTTRTTSTSSRTTSKSSTTSLTSNTTSSTSLTTSLPRSTTSFTRTTTNAAIGTYSLQVVGGCSATRAGTYDEGSVVTVTSQGVCDRADGSGTRVTSWSLDGGAPHGVSTSGQISIPVDMNQSHILTFNDVAQHQLTLDYGATLSLLSITQPTIKGDNYWYDSGQAVTFNGRALTGLIQIAGWSVDDGQLTTVPANSNFTVTIPNMNASHVIHVAITTVSNGCGGSNSCNNSPPSAVYLDTNEPGNVTIKVDGVPYPASVSFYWPTGSSHTISAPISLQSSTSRAAFFAWQGTIVSRNPVLQFKVSGTTKLLLYYRVQYLVRLSFDDSVGNQVVPQNVTLYGANATVILPANFTAWLNYGSKYVLTSAIWQGTEVAGTGPADTFYVDAPSKLVLPLMIYPQTIKVEDPYSLPLSGVNVQISTVGGRILSAVTDANGVATFDVPLGLYYATADFLGISSTVWQGSMGSHSLTLTVYLSYSVIGTITPLVILPILLLIRHRRNEARVVHEIWFGGKPVRAFNQRMGTDRTDK
jgi:hypothetical protein